MMAWFLKSNVSVDSSIFYFVKNTIAFRSFLFFFLKREVDLGRLKNQKSFGSGHAKGNGFVPVF